METQKTRILLVEDDEELSKIMAMRLRKRGYDVICALDGGQTLQAIVSEQTDLVLLDVMLPDTDGHELCRKLRSEEIGYRGPIIFMSCMGDSENIVDAFREGGNDYIVKPAKMEELVERIRVNLKEKSTEQAESSLQWFQQFVVDTRSRSVYRVRDHVR